MYCTVRSQLENKCKSYHFRIICDFFDPWILSDWSCDANFLRSMIHEVLAWREIVYCRGGRRFVRRIRFLSEVSVVSCEVGIWTVNCPALSWWSISLHFSAIWCISLLEETLTEWSVIGRFVRVIEERMKDNYAISNANDKWRYQDTTMNTRRKLYSTTSLYTDMESCQSRCIKLKEIGVIVIYM